MRSIRALERIKPRLKNGIPIDWSRVKKPIDQVIWDLQPGGSVSHDDVLEMLGMQSLPWHPVVNVGPGLVFDEHGVLRRRR